MLLAGFKRGDLGALRGSCHTNLISEPNLDRRTAASLGSLTDRNFMVVERGSLARCSQSTAIYTGEIPGAHRIQHSICVHITATNAAQDNAHSRAANPIDRFFILSPPMYSTCRQFIA